MAAASMSSRGLGGLAHCTASISAACSLDHHHHFTTTTRSQEEQEALKIMADAVMILVNTVMKKTEQQLADSSRVLQEVMTAAADEKVGAEW